jgi:hypothetical protein
MTKTSNGDSPDSLGTRRRTGTALLVGRDCPVNYIPDLLKSRCRHNDGIPSPANVFRNSKKSSSWVLPEVKCKELALNLNLLCK